MTTTVERARLRGLRIAARYRRTPLGRLVQRAVDGFVDIEPFDRAMTLAAQAFVSIVPVMIVMAALRPDEQFFGLFEALQKVQDPLVRVRSLMVAFGAWRVFMHERGVRRVRSTGGY